MANISNKDIYEAVNSLRTELVHRIEKVESQVDENTTFRNQLIGKMTVLFAVIGIGVNLLWDIFVNKK